MMPGAILAINSLPIDKPLETPKIIKGIEWGNTGAMIPPEAINPTERLDRVVCGAHHRHQQRGDRSGICYRGEPERLTIIIAAITPTQPVPPGLWPTSFIGRSTPVLIAPPAFRDFTGQNKKRNTSREKLSAPLTGLRHNLHASNISVCHQSSQSATATSDG